MSVNIAIAAAVGAAAGVFLDAGLLWPARWVLGASLFIAFGLAARGSVGYAIRFVLTAGCAMCVIAGAEAQYRALHPPLRQLLEDQLGGFAIDSVEIYRQDTAVEDDGRQIADATITEDVGTLRERRSTLSL